MYNPDVCIGIDVATPSNFLSCLSKILPIFDGQLTFQMHFDEPSNTMPVIGSILQHPHVKASLCARFAQIFIDEQSIEDDMQRSLQIDTISDWLHQPVIQPRLPYYRTLEIRTALEIQTNDEEEENVARLVNIEHLLNTLKNVT